MFYRILDDRRKRFRAISSYLVVLNRQGCKVKLKEKDDLMKKVEGKTGIIDICVFRDVVRVRA